MIDNDFPASDDLSQIVAAPARSALPQDEQLARIRSLGDATPMVPCPRCAGTGYTRWGICFKCNGKAKIKGFKTPAPVRAANREKAAARKERNAEASWTMFVELQPARAAWIDANPRFDFAVAMKEAVRKYGDLTERQGEAVDRLIARAAEKAAQKATVAPQAAAATFPNLRTTFDALLAKGVRKAQMTAGDLNISLASLSGRNPGALYVKDAGVYVGKIVGERFLAGRDAKADVVARLVVVEADPKAAVAQHARMTAERLAAAQANGETLSLPCGCCGLTLTDPVSIARGIGPICAGKWGF